MTSPTPISPTAPGATRPPARSRSGRRGLATLAVAALALAALAGCSSSKSPSTEDASSGTELTTTTTGPGGTGSTLASIPSGTATVDVGTTDLGQVLVDLTGRTLYVFTDDAAGSPTCVDESCTKVWPPLTGTAIAVGTGVPTTSGEFKLVPRPDGASQLTIYGRPLYTYSGDAGPGQVNGQGVGEKWFVVGLDGQPVQG